jgi:hypothetical protein
MKNFLIRESAFEAAPSLQKKEKNTVEFIAVLQEAGVPNRNGRIYHKYVLEQALNSPYVQERIRTKSFYVECGHPTETSVQRQMTIDQRNIAAIIKEFWWEGNLLKGRLETANTAVGRDMMGLIEQGSRVAFSLRAQGNVHHDPILNATVVDAPIQIATYDWVVNPSHDKAFLEQICEDTRCSLFGISEGNKLALVESARLYEQGELIAMEEYIEEKVVDYAKHFPKKIKKVSEAYIYDEKDVPTISGKFAMIKNGNVTKKVVVEDFVLKSLRNRISKLTESEEVEEIKDFTLDEEKTLTEGFLKDIGFGIILKTIKILPNPMINGMFNKAASKLPPEEKSKVLQSKPTREQKIQILVKIINEARKKNPSMVGKIKQTAKKIKEVQAKEAAKKEAAAPEKELKEAVVEGTIFITTGFLLTAILVSAIALITTATLSSIFSIVLYKLGQRSEFNEQVEVTLGDAAAEPVHDGSEAKEHTPEVTNKDILVGQHAEEVKEVIVEAGDIEKAQKDAEIKKMEAMKAQKELQVAKQTQAVDAKIEQLKDKPAPGQEMKKEVK